MPESILCAGDALVLEEYHQGLFVRVEHGFSQQHLAQEGVCYIQGAVLL